ncbi:hypothetical protein AAG570_011770 [Ranatra chinensis]|uniref:Uncharacterized protein n=1 Tax=Ranatra chinensis TaxID=642074 RepID=A0ABD0YHC0_9HEMI
MVALPERVSLVYEKGSKVDRTRPVHWRSRPPYSTPTDVELWFKPGAKAALNYGDKWHPQPHPGRWSTAGRGRARGIDLSGPPTSYATASRPYRLDSCVSIGPTGGARNSKPFYASPQVPQRIIPISTGRKQKIAGETEEEFIANRYRRTVRTEACGRYWQS